MCDTVCQPQCPTHQSAPSLKALLALLNPRRWVWVHCLTHAAAYGIILNMAGPMNEVGGLKIKQSFFCPISREGIFELFFPFFQLSSMDLPEFGNFPSPNTLRSRCSEVLGHPCGLIASLPLAIQIETKRASNKWALFILTYFDLVSDWFYGWGLARSRLETSWLCDIVGFCWSFLISRPPRNLPAARGSCKTSLSGFADSLHDVGSTRLTKHPADRGCCAAISRKVASSGCCHVVALRADGRMANDDPMIPNYTIIGPR